MQHPLKKNPNPVLKLEQKARFIRYYWDSDYYNLSFLGNPKCASSAVRFAIRAGNKDMVKKPKHNLIFSIVRKPLDRIVSSYAETLRRGTLIPLLKAQNMSQDQLFSYFIWKLKNHGFYDVHLYPQYMYVGYKLANYVFTVENIDLLWDWLDLDTIPNPTNRTFFQKPTPTKSQLTFLKDVYSIDWELYEYYSRYNNT